MAVKKKLIANTYTRLGSVWRFVPGFRSRVFLKSERYPGSANSEHLLMPTPNFVRCLGRMFSIRFCIHLPTFNVSPHNETQQVSTHRQATYSCDFATRALYCWSRTLNSNFKVKQAMRQIPFLAVTLVFASWLSGCADKPYVAPVHIGLQDPMPGQSIVYLLRAPHDAAAVLITIDNKRVAILQPETYTAIGLSPGQHALRTMGAGSEIAPVFEFNIKPDERQFFNISGATNSSMRLSGLVPMAGGGVLPLFEAESRTVQGTRAWKEVKELDAQGLMSISEPVLPDRDAY